MRFSDTAFAHHGNQISKIQLEAQIPAHAQHHDLPVKLATLDQLFDRYESWHLPIIANSARVCTRTLVKTLGIVGSEFPAPLPDGFVRNNDSTFCQKIFNITEAQAEAMIDPYGVADDVRREAVSVVTGLGAVHEMSLSVGLPELSAKLTKPLHGRVSVCRGLSAIWAANSGFEAR